MSFSREENMTIKIRIENTDIRPNAVIEVSTISEYNDPIDLTRRERITSSMHVQNGDSIEVYVHKNQKILITETSS